MSAPALGRSSRSRRGAYSSTPAPADRAPRTPGKRRRPPGWVPNQHGAWAMLVAPYLVGLVAVIADGRFELADVVLFGLWIVGYFAFFATSLWLKSRRKARYLPPVRAYVTASAVLGVATLLLQPSIVSWLLPFVPVLLVGLYFAYQRDDRSIASGVMTVAAACLMPAVVYADGIFDFFRGLGTAGYDVIAFVCVVSFGYFFGTVLYVKTMIRERGHIGYVVVSVAWHALCTAGSAVLALAWPELAAVGWVLTVFFAAMTARALALPLMFPLRGRVLSAKHLGIGEVFSTVGLVGVLVAAVL